MTPIMKTSNIKNTLIESIMSGDIIYVCPDMIDNFIVKEFSDSSLKEG